MFKWEKLGIVFSPQKTSSEDWMHEFAQGPSVLIFDDFIRVYFSCRPPRDKNGQYVSYSGFVDFDRNNLFKVINTARSPILPLGKLGAFDEFGTYPVSVIKNEGNIWAYYGGWTRCESVPFNVSIGLAISDNNGVTFDKVGDGPVLSYSLNEPFILSGPKIRKFNDTFYLFYIAGSKWIENKNLPEPVYKIRLATSIDGKNWSRVDKNLIDSRLEENECQASPDVFFFKGKYHMFFCYRYSIGYRGREKGYRIGYASSDNLIDWERNDEMAGISISTNGWDSEMVSYPHVFELDGNVFMFYLGNQVGKEGFGVAKLVHNEI